MKKTYSILCAFVLAGSFFGCSTTQQKTSETDYTQYVNTFIGAADNGHTFSRCLPSFQHDPDKPRNRSYRLEILLGICVHRLPDMGIYPNTP